MDHIFKRLVCFAERFFLHLHSFHRFYYFLCSSVNEFTHPPGMRELVAQSGKRTEALTLLRLGGTEKNELKLEEEWDEVIFSGKPCNGGFNPCVHSHPKAERPEIK
ncbi:hypothetical protein TNCV_3252051 [Trichonephila clavipes]|nr:hypothetical protein TNCV_3252051 [Trichonephila clavipes]